ncbi:hypothetical protein ATANTOWER_021466 [Ataeniobius toweri]|uniref:Uncharacterized protein n=1 Tax=Ataeniobius toweri TaxID=208326 RepID=A0ABU7A866_9TELE|nr:hypothetical protein [Ataeniobius toweri]
MLVDHDEHEMKGRFSKGHKICTRIVVNKMAPVCVARLLSLETLFVCCLYVLFSNLSTPCLCIIAKTLLDLQLYANDVAYCGDDGQKTVAPFLTKIPACLHRDPAPLLRNKRRRGKRSGRQVKMSMCLMRFTDGPRTVPKGVPRLFSWRSLYPVDTWLAPVVGPDEVLSSSPLPWGEPAQFAASSPRSPYTDYPGNTGSCEDRSGKCQISNEQNFYLEGFFFFSV